MTDLVVILSTGKGSWSHVVKIIQSGEWGKVYIITNSFGKQTFSPKQNMELLELDLDKDSVELSDEIYAMLKDRLSGLDIAVNLTSGTGKEHMALLSALIRTGTGMRFIDFKEGIVEL